VHANKVCRHTIISTLSNELLDVYVSYKEAKKIWESMITKYTAEDATKQKFVIGNYCKWEMTEDKDITAQINEYHKLIEDLKSEDISLPEQFVAGMLIEKLPKSWNDYKQQLKHKHKQLIFCVVIMENNAANVAVDATTPTAPAVSVAVPSPITYAKPFPDVSKIEVFGGDNFKRWQERVHSI
ncbi:hypothetical protein A4A49_62088, partial [Nicotiana attenuata]